MKKTFAVSAIGLLAGAALWFGLSTGSGEADTPSGESYSLTQDFNFQAECTDKLAAPDMVHDPDFWARVVSQEKYALIGDTDHENPHLLSVLDNDDVLRAWADNGVTDIYLEARPHLQEEVDALLGQPDARQKITEILVENYDQANLYDVGEWKNIRADYTAGLIVKAHELGMKAHLFSEMPPVFENKPRMAQLYALYTQLNLASCNGIHLLDFLEEAEKFGFTHDEQMEFMTLNDVVYIERLKQDADHAQFMRDNNNGGRAVVFIGNGHLAFGHDIEVPNLRAHLGYENTTLVEMFQKEDRAKRSSSYLARYDEQSYRYALDTGRSLQRRTR